MLLWWKEFEKEEHIVLFSALLIPVVSVVSPAVDLCMSNSSFQLQFLYGKLMQLTASHVV